MIFSRLLGCCALHLRISLIFVDLVPLDDVFSKFIKNESCRRGKYLFKKSRIIEFRCMMNFLRIFKVCWPAHVICCEFSYEIVNHASWGVFSPCVGSWVISPWVWVSAPRGFVSWGWIGGIWEPSSWGVDPCLVVGGTTVLVLTSVTVGVDLRVLTMVVVSFPTDGAKCYCRK
jgi:hypothetical protein